ncbi:hypothetical protein ZIOFF_026861 [Zingiber officinale]|uniref:Uncharacterized protein n=1 Tax=Zingiber officinale TaxID=94328 RepID=A0A8J5GZE9_ZINOF|nr:hypothetical protein ZIOFF_026861 [Zingiber officinale]
MDRRPAILCLSLLLCAAAAAIPASAQSPAAAPSKAATAPATAKTTTPVPASAPSKPAPAPTQPSPVPAAAPAAKITTPPPATAPETPPPTAPANATAPATAPAAMPPATSPAAAATPPAPVPVAAPPATSVPPAAAPVIPSTPVPAAESPVPSETPAPAASKPKKKKKKGKKAVAPAPSSLAPLAASPSDAASPGPSVAADEVVQVVIPGCPNGNDGGHPAYRGGLRRNLKSQPLAPVCSRSPSGKFPFHSFLLVSRNFQSDLETPVTAPSETPASVANDVKIPTHKFSSNQVEAKDAEKGTGSHERNLKATPKKRRLMENNSILSTKEVFSYYIGQREYQKPTSISPVQRDFWQTKRKGGSGATTLYSLTFLPCTYACDPRGGGGLRRLAMIGRHQLKGKLLARPDLDSEGKGNKCLSQWKGSVMDFFVGAILLQNVFDTISRFALMSLAVKFPLKEIDTETG